MARRSLLFSPADRPELLRKGPKTGADAVVFDLEDAVAPGRKDVARAAVAELLADPDFEPSCEVCVRVNPEPATDEDLTAILAGGRPDAVVLPKVETPEAVGTLDRLLAEHGCRLPIIAVIESAAGILAAADIAAAPVTSAVVFGAEDLRVDLGAERTPEATEVLYARQHLRLAASVAGIEAIDMVFTAYDDVEGLAEEARAARQLGYDGKLAIHPDQIGPINDAFRPGSEEIAWAERVLAARQRHPNGGVFEVDGEMIDAPLVAQAERIVDRADAPDDSP